MINICSSYLYRQIPRCYCSALTTLQSFSYSTAQPEDGGRYKWRKPWGEDENFTPSKFSLWMPTGGNLNFIKKMHQNYDLSFNGIKKMIYKKKLDIELIKQRYIPERHQILGPDLATAHFIVFRGGSVKFHGEKEWKKLDENDEINLPNTKVEGMFLEAVDASGMNLHFVALSNIVFLQKLTWLSLANNLNVDDWFLDKISNDHEKLEYLDISGCKKVSDRGIAILSRLSKLRKLKVENVTDTVELRLACLSLMEFMPRLEVEGIDFETPLEQKAL